MKYNDPHFETESGRSYYHYDQALASEAEELLRKNLVACDITTPDKFIELVFNKPHLFVGLMSTERLKNIIHFREDEERLLKHSEGK